MTRPIWLGLVLVASACDGTLDVEATPYVFDEVAPIAPADQPSVVADAIQGTVDRLLELHAAPVLAAYATALATRDEICPEQFYELGPSSDWYGQCETGAGGSFQGYATNEVIPEGEQPVNSLAGAATVVTTEGHTFSFGGSCYQGSRLQEDGVLVGYTGLNGNFGWDGPGSADSWLGSDVQPGLDYYWALLPGLYAAVGVNGAVSGLDGTARAVRFDDVTVNSGECPGEPSGSISVRGSDGWYDVLFDHPRSDEEWEAFDRSLCDGCGEAWYRGSRIGEVCVDFSALYTFEEAPW